MPLITAQDLMTQIHDENLTIVDCRWYLGKPTDGLDAYAAGHIPGAVYGDLETDLSAPANGGRHPLPSPQEFDTTLRRWGVTKDSKVVVYDDRGGAIAARLWWMLTQQGHQDTFLLDGGMHAWRDAGGQLTADIPVVETTSPHAGIQVTDWTGTVEIADVAERADDVVVADARGADRYRGDTEPIDGKAGHIPGAINFPMTTNLDGPRFKSPEELRSTYAAVDIDTDTQVIMHCGSGVTACHNILAMEVAGLGRPDLYVGSWSDWSSSDNPIATGTEPG
jgi:thiosulfate/3-mercaptopyruvate sulfurtransferase